MTGPSAFAIRRIRAENARLKKALDMIRELVTGNYYDPEEVLANVRNVVELARFPAIKETKK